MGDRPWPVPAVDYRSERQVQLDRKERRIARFVAALMVLLAVGMVAATAVATVALVTLRDRGETIKALEQQVAALTDEVNARNARIDELADQVVALQLQIAELGAQPVVVDRPTEANDATNSAPEPEHPPSDPDRPDDGGPVVCVVDICVGG